MGYRKAAQIPDEHLKDAIGDTFAVDYIRVFDISTYFARINSVFDLLLFVLISTIAPKKQSQLLL